MSERCKACEDADPYFCDACLERKTVTRQSLTAAVEKWNNQAVLAPEISDLAKDFLLKELGL